VDLQTILGKLFANAGAVGIEGVFQFVFGPHQAFWSEVKASSHTQAGRHASPDVTIEVAEKDFLGIMAGQANVEELFASGRLKIGGNMGLATLLPQAIAALILGGLLFVVVGTEQLKHLSEVMAQMQVIAESGGKADPSMLEGLPVGRLLLWVLLVLVSFVAVKWMTFIAAPQILFSGADALASMRNSLRACLHNWTAMLVFYLLAGIAIFAISIGLFVIALLLQLVVGATLAMLVWQLLLLAVLMPVLAGAAYYAWRQMMGATDPAVPSQMATQIEV